MSPSAAASRGVGQGGMPRRRGDHAIRPPWPPGTPTKSRPIHARRRRFASCTLPDGSRSTRFGPRQHFRRHLVGCPPDRSHGRDPHPLVYLRPIQGRRLRATTLCTETTPAGARARGRWEGGGVSFHRWRQPRTRRPCSMPRGAEPHGRTRTRRSSCPRTTGPAAGTQSWPSRITATEWSRVSTGAPASTRRAASHEKIGARTQFPHVAWVGRNRPERLQRKALRHDATPRVAAQPSHP
jgi:hypothetical protein